MAFRPSAVPAAARLIPLAAACELFLMEDLLHVRPPCPRLAALERHLHRLHDVPPLAHAGRGRQGLPPGLVLRGRPRVFEVGAELAVKVVDREVADPGLADGLRDFGPDCPVVALVLLDRLLTPVSSALYARLASGKPPILPQVGG